MHPFIILANARSGSTSLAKLLSESPGVHLVMEPFHPKFTQWNPTARNYSTFIVDTKTMNQALDEIFSTYNAMKVLEYQIDPEIYCAMLARKDFRIILLQRANLAQAALSSLIAQQTAIWHMDELKKDAYEQLQPIPIDKIAEIVDYVSEINAQFAAFCEKHRENEYLFLKYEQLYSEDMDVNMHTITTICSFLDIPLPPQEKIEQYMKPSHSKQNQDMLYKKVPNWEEIQKVYPQIFEPY